LIITTLGGGILTLIGSNLYFRPKLKEAKAEALKKEAEAQNFIYDSLVERLNQMDKQYAAQGKVITELQKEILELSKEKLENEKRIIKLEDENKNLREEVDSLREQLKAYKIINNQ